jgi:hypothetical protein
MYVSIGVWLIFIRLKFRHTIVIRSDSYVFLNYCPFTIASHLNNGAGNSIGQHLDGSPVSYFWRIKDSQFLLHLFVFQ